MFIIFCSSALTYPAPYLMVQFHLLKFVKDETNVVKIERMLYKGVFYH